LGAKPLLRELRELAGRARITLPPEVDELLDGKPIEDGAAAPAADEMDGTAAAAVDQRNGRSDLVRAIAGDPPSPRRTRHVRASGRSGGPGLVAQGRTTARSGRGRSSRKTVGVHAGNILAKSRSE
jgi:hypothetical protein